MPESGEIWEKIYDVSPKLGRTVRKLINIRCFEEDMNYFDGKLILKPNSLRKEKFFASLKVGLAKSFKPSIDVHA